MYSKKVYFDKKDKKWVFEILKDGYVFIRQDFKPRVQGFQKMTEEEANQEADLILKEFEIIEKIKEEK